ncbi:Hypothetical predicted protein [Olea europaea subsp. europaea]|uniref:Uncharacterized protein n=1 Tax=Olea europaea subsp. europaea TaxID=158383 RepID=A0A8S0UHA2_OLEEU|nr:Hypothetical predicted protein [Olea europaea subsp. europaea]
MRRFGLLSGVAIGMGYIKGAPYTDMRTIIVMTFTSTLTLSGISWLALLNRILQDLNRLEDSSSNNMSTPQKGRNNVGYWALWHFSYGYNLACIRPK